jgi:maltose O-acetyltransferase
MTTLHQFRDKAARLVLLARHVRSKSRALASGAVVTKNVEPWTIAGGVPAKFIKNRPKVEYTLDTRNKALFQ